MPKFILNGHCTGKVEFYARFATIGDSQSRRFLVAIANDFGPLPTKSPDSAPELPQNRRNTG